MAPVDSFVQGSAGQLPMIKWSLGSIFSYASAKKALLCLTALTTLRSPPFLYETKSAAQATLSHKNGDYLLGVGISDVTGPVVETNMFGYASLEQTDSGLHMRQFSRAFIVADTANPSQRIVYVNSDISAGDTAVRRGILGKLESLYPGLYTESNFALVGTHSHSGVGGYLNNLLPQFTSLGFVNQTYEAIVDGTVRAIIQAHNSLAPGYLSLGNTVIDDASINRSPYSYLANPAEERARYSGDIDKTMSLLKFERADGADMGFLSFFAVHGTSIYENNTLISTDNKGMAAYLYESYMNPKAVPGKTSFVAGFSQSTSGDVRYRTPRFCQHYTHAHLEIELRLFLAQTPSPILIASRFGAFCESPGKPWDGERCDFQRSTCGNRTQDCHGRGPGYLESDFKSNEIIGTKQFEGARFLVEDADLEPVNGPVRGVHVYADMSNYTFALKNGTVVSTCSAALGFSFAGGTTDGPGAFDFVQGVNSTSRRNPMWEMFKGAVTPPPSEEQKACQYPKPILLNVGSAHSPYHWSPAIVDIQMFRVGQLVILVLPSEFTTMSGRRLREAVRTTLIQQGIIGENAYVVAAGPANTYAHYTTTREEYGVQRYEGASTLYGPNQLDAYIDLSRGSHPEGDLITGKSSASYSIYLFLRAFPSKTPVVVDRAPLFKHFGTVLNDVQESYVTGDTVSVVFQGANPRNNLHLEGTFFTIKRLKRDHWVIVRTDSHPSTTFRWTRTNKELGYSTVNITWTIEANTQPGEYRIQYYGDAKHFFGSIESFSAVSSTFHVGY
ncbi:hypothetical protein FRB99_004064 [Tulasnella sp. 403]|nr:hypothetical protein FRB99_004064 [Tulasnella sp. 403]